jgi:hypothetical protein
MVQILHHTLENKGRPEILREIAQQVNLDGMAQGAQGLDLNLANALAGELKACAQLLKGMAMPILKAVAEFDHLAFACVQRL